MVLRYGHSFHHDDESLLGIDGPIRTHLAPCRTLVRTRRHRHRPLDWVGQHADAKISRSDNIVFAIGPRGSKLRERQCRNWMPRLAAIPIACLPSPRIAQPDIALDAPNVHVLRPADGKLIAGLRVEAEACGEFGGKAGAQLETRRIFAQQCLITGEGRRRLRVPVVPGRGDERAEGPSREPGRMPVACLYGFYIPCGVAPTRFYMRASRSSSPIVASACADRAA